LNWVTDDEVVAHEQRRHRFTMFLKRLNPFGNVAARAS
jgi:SM-20-related protein